jgi:hypothetical protein
MKRHGLVFATEDTPFDAEKAGIFEPSPRELTPMRRTSIPRRRSAQLQYKASQAIVHTQ